MRRVGVIGHGAIGSVVAAELTSGRIAGCTLAGVLTQAPRCDIPFRVAGVDELIERSDIVVEAAGHAAVEAHCPAVLDAGIDLLMVSVGALVDDGLRQRLTGRAGRLLLSAGAIGGLGLLRAAALFGSIDGVRLTTTKSPSALLAPWMPRALVDDLRHGTQPVTVFEGTARDAVARFPESINVAATLALATVGFERTHVRVVGDRAAARVTHVIRVEGAAGRYELHIENTPSANPRTSAITPYNVLRALGDMSDSAVIGL